MEGQPKPDLEDIERMAAETADKIDEYRKQQGKEPLREPKGDLELDLSELENDPKNIQAERFAAETGEQPMSNAEMAARTAEAEEAFASDEAKQDADTIWSAAKELDRQADEQKAREALQEHEDYVKQMDAETEESIVQGKTEEAEAARQAQKEGAAAAKQELEERKAANLRMKAEAAAATASAEAEVAKKAADQKAMEEIAARHQQRAESGSTVELAKEQQSQKAQAEFAEASSEEIETAVDSAVEEIRIPEAAPATEAVPEAAPIVKDDIELFAEKQRQLEVERMQTLETSLADSRNELASKFGVTDADTYAQQLLTSRWAKAKHVAKMLRPGFRKAWKNFAATDKEYDALKKSDVLKDVKRIPKNRGGAKQGGGGTWIGNVKL